MILELDMGNTRIKWRLRNESGNVARGHLLSQSAWQSLASSITITIKTEVPELQLPLRLQQLRVASVLDEERNQSFREWCLEAYGVQADFAVSQPAAAGVINGYEHPEQLGVDRWLAILAGFTQAKRAVVVADLGSALTVDLVTARGEHLGGYIGPGLAAMRNTLLGNTQKIRLTDVSSVVRTAPGRSTDTAVTAALSTMMIGLITAAMKELASHGEDPALVITGGDAELLPPFFPGASIIPELVLDGLALASENR
jgi:type III pantothenate kinase